MAFYKQVTPRIFNLTSGDGAPARVRKACR